MSKIKNNFKIKKYISILIIILLLVWFSLNFSRAWETEENINKLTEEDKKNYNHYIKSVNEKCIKYKAKKPSYKTEEYQSKPNKTDLLKSNWNNLFILAKEQYRKNQNWIYKCSIIKIQKNVFNLVKNDLLKIDKTWDIVSEMKKKIELRERKIKNNEKQFNCKITEKKKIFSKQDVLNETTYELCRYTFYLEYLKKYYNNMERSINVTKTQKETRSYSINNLVDSFDRIQENIKNEKLHSYKVYELAFQSYIEYENNLAPHILLELIKQDFLVYREKLHETLGPLNQVIYKIVNAMSK